MESLGQAHLFGLRLARYFGEVHVLSLRGIEATNALYRFRVRVAVPLADAQSFAAAAPEGPVTLSLLSDAGTRVVHGIVGALTTRDAATGTHATFDLRIVPRLERLLHIKRSRIFQEKTTPEILAQVLTERGIRHRWRMQRAYEKRSYTTQYVESELAFVQRLCAEEGIFTFFDHPRESGPDDMTGLGDSEVLVFADTAEGTSPIEGAADLRYRAHQATGGMQPDEHHVHDFSMRRALRTKAVFLRSFSHGSPLLEHRDLAASQAPGGQPLRTPQDPGRAQLAQGVTTYEHLGTREETRTIPAAASIGLEQARRSSLRGRGSSACRRLVPGRFFRLHDHDAMDLNGEYAVVRVEHIGRAPQAGTGHPVYENHFEVIPRDVAARPKRPDTRSPAMHETAVVVGPPGHEVHTDALGRVKVQFHWDLEGERDEKSSCWLRVTQAWAGAGFGAQFIPRVGMEVLVSFLGGDPDRPIVTGCLYNGVHPLPFRTADPMNGLRTQTLSDHRSGHELILDDRPTQQLFAMHSSNRMSIRSAAEMVRHAGTNLEDICGGNRQQTTEGESHLRVGLDQSLDVGTSSRTTVGGHSVLQVALDQQTRIGGNHEIEVLGTERTTVHGSKHVIVGGADEEGYAAVGVHGLASASATHDLMLESQKRITLRVGKTLIEIDKEGVAIRTGRFTVDGANIVLRPSGSTALRLGELLELHGDTVRITSSGASLILDSEAKLDGALVKLNCGGEAGAGTSSATADPTGLQSSSSTTFSLAQASSSASRR